jgi:hypothetical protein
MGRSVHLGALPIKSFIIIVTKERYVMNIILDIIVAVIFVTSMVYMLPRLTIVLKEELKNNRMRRRIK